MWQLWSGFFWSLKFLTGEWRLMASGCFKPLQLGDWSTLSNYLSSWFFYLLYFFTLWVLFFWISIWKTWNFGEWRSHRPAGRGAVHQVLDRLSLRPARPWQSHSTDMDSTEQLDVPWPTRNVPMQWITCQWHVRLCQTCSFSGTSEFNIEVGVCSRSVCG